MRREVLRPFSPPVVDGHKMNNSPGIRTEQFIFTVGLTARDPITNEIVVGDVRLQTRRVLDNLKILLESGGSSLEKVVQLLVHLAQQEDFIPFDEEYASYFPENPPARTIVVAKLSRDDFLVEVTAIALV